MLAGISVKDNIISKFVQKILTLVINIKFFCPVTGISLFVPFLLVIVFSVLLRRTLLITTFVSSIFFLSAIGIIFFNG